MQEIEFELPHDNQAEQAVLGAILISSDACDTADEMLRGDEFYSPVHTKIFETMCLLREEGIPVDLITLTARLEETKLLGDIGGVVYLSELQISVPTAGNVAYYISIVKDRHIHRQSIIDLKDQLRSARQSDNPAEIVASLQNTANKMADRTTKGKGLRKISELAEDHFEVVERRYAKRDSGLTGVKTPLTDMDRLTGGRQKQDLIIVAARPSVGKTAFEMNEAVCAAKSGTVKAVAFFSLEMGDISLMDRFAAMLGNIDGMKFRTGRMEGDDWEKYTLALSEISNLPLYLDTDPGLTIHQIRTKSRAFKREHGEIEIIVDYLQMITSGQKFPNRDTEVGYITQQLKEMAKELDCPVIAISALGRSVEQRADKRPMLSDLRESGQIEFYADEVDFLYRDDYYDKESEKKNIVEIDIAKGRNTGTGKVEAVYLRNYSRFVNLERVLPEQVKMPIPDEDDKKNQRRRYA